MNRRLQTTVNLASLCLLTWALNAADAAPAPAHSPPKTTTVGASIVRITRKDGGWRLSRNGKPYFIRGAVTGPGGSLDVLQQAGGNSIRTHAGALDDAQRRGFTALVGLPLGNPRKGFDYADTNKVEQQYNRVRDIVRQFRDHPALLMWNLGNEPEINTTPAQRVPLWREANRLAEMVRREDPNHPVMVVVGGQYADMLHELNDLLPGLGSGGPELLRPDAETSGGDCERRLEPVPTS